MRIPQGTQLRLLIQSFPILFCLWQKFAEENWKALYKESVSKKPKFLSQNGGTTQTGMWCVRNGSVVVGCEV